MNIQIGKESIKIYRNRNNKFWNPIGQFYNISEIKINNEWYKCGIRFLKKDNKNYVQLFHPMKVDEKTSIIKEVYTEGIFKEIETSKFKVNLLKYLLNEHKINYKSFKIRKRIADRRKTIYAFSCATILSVVYYGLNEMYNNALMNYIANNNWIQTLIIFLTVSSFINIFYPFTLKKEIGKQDIEEITKDTLKQDRINKEIEKRASF